MTGHASGIGSVGGIYDRTPEINPRILETEYAKLEPYLNIYSGKTGQVGWISEEDQEMFALLLQKFKEGKVQIS